LLIPDLQQGLRLSWSLKEVSIASDDRTQPDCLMSLVDIYIPSDKMPRSWAKAREEQRAKILALDGVESPSPDLVFGVF
jgi:hypothetical protein